MADRRCPNCGELVPAFSLTCPKCYRSIPREEPEGRYRIIDDDRAPTPRMTNRRLVLILSILPAVFGLFGLGNPGSGVWMFILSMIVYGVAFDFFNISGSLFVNKETDVAIRSSAQGLFMIMTNGIGATIGTLGAQAVVNHFGYSQQDAEAMVAGWSQSWLVFAGYALVVAVVFAVVFRYRHDPTAIETK